MHVYLFKNMYIYEEVKLKLQRNKTKLSGTQRFM